MSRMIDADTVKAYLKRAIWGADAKIDGWVDAMPGVDAELVKHGRWVKELDRYNHWHCSECEYVEGLRVYVSNYCPNCGARMLAEPWEKVGFGEVIKP